MSEQAVQTESEQALAILIVETLYLQDVLAETILPTDALFREGLGLDSIDALEISLAISMNYGVKLKANDAKNANIFSSLRSLNQYIESNKA